MSRVFLIFFLIASIALVFSDEIDEVRNLLLAERGGDILYLSRINLGIPKGDNWIVERSDGWAYIYTIDSDKNVDIVDCRTFAEPSEIKFNSKEDLEFDIMRDIPGTRIGNKAATFGDFNGDGLDEIFDFYNTKSLCTISGYNSDKGEMESIFGCHYDIISPKGPSPVEFLNNQGEYYIKVSLWDLKENKYIWVFWAWDEVQRRWIEIEEWKEFYEEQSQLVLSEQNKNDLAEGRDTQEEALFALANGKNSGLKLYIVIPAAIIALGAVTVFIVVKRKKK